MAWRADAAHRLLAAGPMHPHSGQRPAAAAAKEKCSGAWHDAAEPRSLSTVLPQDLGEEYSLVSRGKVLIFG